MKIKSFQVFTFLMMIISVLVGGCAALTKVKDGTKEKYIDMIVIDEIIEIDLSIQDVFVFVFNYENDPQWREEVQEMTFDRGEGPFLGRLATERSIVLGDEIVTVTEVIEYDPPYKIISRTLEGVPAWLEAYRFLEEIEGNKTKLNYKLLVENTTFFPTWFVEWSYGGTVENYLRTLKELLEKK